MTNKDKIQKEAIDSVIHNKGSGIIASATGTGKTKMAINYIEKLKNKG